MAAIAGSGPAAVCSAAFCSPAASGGWPGSGSSCSGSACSGSSCSGSSCSGSACSVPVLRFLVLRFRLLRFRLLRSGGHGLHGRVLRGACRARGRPPGTQPLSPRPPTGLPSPVSGPRPDPSAWGDPVLPAPDSAGPARPAGRAAPALRGVPARRGFPAEGFRCRPCPGPAGPYAAGSRRPCLCPMSARATRALIPCGDCAPLLSRSRHNPAGLGAQLQLGRDAAGEFNRLTTAAHLSLPSR